MTPTLLLAGGGTGGHVFPSLAVADALARAADMRIAFVGTARGLESRLVPEAGWPLHEIAVLPLARKVSPSTLRVPGALLRAAGQVARVIRAEGVVGAAVFGGYVSLPLALAAWRTGTPYVVHEQNAVPGLANRVAVRRAAAVAATFPSSVAAFGRGVRVEVTGNPVRPGLAGVDRAALRPEALRTFGLEPGRRTLLVFGGSQGARRLNAALVEALERWPDPGALQILHATGRGGHAAAQAAWSQALAAARGPVPLVRPVDFVERMDLAYAAADVVVCRAGASTIAELTMLGLPSVLVPYPHATADHQTANAADLATAGGARTVVDGELDAASLVAAAQPLLADPALRAEMGAAARRFARPDAAERVAALLRGAAGLAGPAWPRAPRPAHRAAWKAVK
jgi:UDP-N-acetylglucosamine--N-acetylmuramyl-(pentapeptide) pyrophosphoryl-undecaprenol N-acetylglucosamine transferase